MTIYSPFVYWAQNKKCVFLKIDLKDVQDPAINLEGKKLEFNSKGVGARGLQDYAFTINFFGSIKPKDSIHKITDNRVEFTLTKMEKGWWTRLCTEIKKPVWLKIDHDKFQSEEIEEDEKQVNDIRDDYPNLHEKLQREEFGYKKEDFKFVYLTLYNLFMYVGFMYIVCVLSIRYLRDGPNSFAGAYDAVGPAMCFLQLLQGLEILHPIFGYVKGGMLIPLIQIGGRNLILFFMLESEPRMQTMPVVFYLFMTWSAIEIIRYPFYMSRLFKRENGLLTWLRYSAWMICYPIGFICEGVIIFRNILFLDQSDKWSIALTNPIEITLKFSYVLRIYLLFISIPFMYLLMSHMYKARQKIIGPVTLRNQPKIKKSK